MRISWPLFSKHFVLFGLFNGQRRLIFSVGYQETMDSLPAKRMCLSMETVSTLFSLIFCLFLSNSNHLMRIFAQVARKKHRRRTLVNAEQTKASHTNDAQAH